MLVAAWPLRMYPPPAHRVTRAQAELAAKEVAYSCETGCFHWQNVVPLSLTCPAPPAPSHVPHLGSPVDCSHPNQIEQMLAAEAAQMLPTLEPSPRPSEGLRGLRRLAVPPNQHAELQFELQG